MSALLARILEEVEALPMEERQQLRHWLDQAPASPSVPPGTEEFLRRLATEGIVRLPEPALGSGPEQRDWQPVPCRGKPVSEALIEERR
ncbi:MAG: hypothetical protein FJ388_18755 [Verrucomicrobia bacterium]|nr:hypothetical protein [Verrucomicrobiota bacterium]